MGHSEHKAGWRAGASLTGLAMALLMPAVAGAQVSTSSTTPTQQSPTSVSAPTSPVTQSQVEAGDATPGSPAAAAQVQTSDASPTPAVPDQVANEVVVTGTNLNNGFRAPTPVTVTTADQLKQSSPNNIADGLTKLPVFAGSISTNSPGSNATAGNVGQNLLNLRNLGDNRNLVLLDGRRIVATNTDFAVDVNTLPQNLIARVDVVTGGASAAYGSDAVAGVVNFVLDTKFVGVKGDFTGGTSTYGDLPSGKISLAVGFKAFDDRLHVVASTEEFGRRGLGVTQYNPRTWYTRPAGLIPNVLSSSPANLVVPDIRTSNGSAGGAHHVERFEGHQLYHRGQLRAVQHRPRLEHGLPERWRRLHPQFRLHPRPDPQHQLRARDVRHLGQRLRLSGGRVFILAHAVPQQRAAVHRRLVQPDDLSR